MDVYSSNLLHMHKQSRPIIIICDFKFVILKTQIHTKYIILNECMFSIFRHSHLVAGILFRFFFRISESLFLFFGIRKTTKKMAETIWVDVK